jgi:hypothetical protein
MFWDILHILVCASSHTRVHVRERACVGGGGDKAKPRIFLSKYLPVDSVDIAEMFG